MLILRSYILSKQNRVRLLFTNNEGLTTSSQATKYKILIASPSDAVKERKIIPEVIEYWNTVNSDHYGVILKPVLWEIDATPKMGKRPQDIINKQLVRSCDILVGTFWTRLGTHTGKAESGTVEEIEEFLKDGKPVLLYFSSIPVVPENINIEQYHKLSQFKKKCEKEGLVTSYESIDELQRKLQMHITKTINEIHKEPIDISEESEDVLEERSKTDKTFLQTNERVAIKALSTAVPNSSGGGSGHAFPDITATKTMLPRVFDERKLPPIGSAQLPYYYWNVQNFEGFFYDPKDDLGKESLLVLQPNLGASQRTIEKDKLIYSTVAELKKLKVVENAFGNNIADAAAAGLSRTGSGEAFNGGNYYIIGWQAQPYVVLNGKVDKLAQLIIEQGTVASEKKTLRVGETWDIGGGWTLTANAIDAKAIPRQVWLTLSKDGIKKDDRVVAEKRIYTYVERNIAGETDVPLFVTYVDSVFVGATSYMVQLRYTWAVSTAVTQIKSSDTYGVFKDASIDSTTKTLSLKNSDIEIILSPDAIVDLMGNLKFKVADRADVLRFYPLVLKE